MNISRKAAKLVGKHAFSIAILFATTLCAVYLFGLASDRYISESRFTVKSQSEGSAGGLDLGILGSTTATKQDQLIIRDYLRSSDMMKKVFNEFGIELLTADRADLFWHINEKTRFKDRLAHYRSLIDFTYDEEASISTLITQGFEADVALRLNAFLVSAAEVYINEFSEKTSSRFIEFAQKDVEEAKAEVAYVTDMIRRAQESSRMVNPETDIRAIASTIGTLETLLSQQKGELTALLGYLQEETHQVAAQRAQIQSTETQLAELRSRLAGDQGKDLAAASLSFAQLESNLEFANANYASALKTLEAAKIQAMQARKYLMTVEQPDTPDYAEYPKPFINLAMCIAVLLMCAMLIKSLIRILREY